MEKCFKAKPVSSSAKIFHYCEVCKRYSYSIFLFLQFYTKIFLASKFDRILYLFFIYNETVKINFKIKYFLFFTLIFKTYLWKIFAMRAWQEKWLLKEVLFEFSFGGLEQQAELNI